LLIGVFFVVIIIPFCKSSTTTTTTMTGPTTTTTQNGRLETCILFGDPHVVTFDGISFNSYVPGNYTIVKTDTVNIQGRYDSTPFTHGLSVVKEIGVTGSFIRGQTIKVVPLEDGRVIINGQLQPKDQPWRVELEGNLGVVTYNDMGVLPDDNPQTRSWPKNVVHMVLADRVTVEVFRWENYMDVRIVMPIPPGGVLGQCGPGTGSRADAEPLQVMRRSGVLVPQRESLFGARQQGPLGQGVLALLEACPQDKRLEGDAECDALSLVGGQIDKYTNDVCRFNVCYGQNRHVETLVRNFVAP